MQCEQKLPRGGWRATARSGQGRGHGRHPTPCFPPVSPTTSSAVHKAQIGEPPAMAEASKASESSSTAMSHPLRPDYGTAGRKCVVHANHFLVHVADRDFCHYDVTITPEIASRDVRRAVISQLINLYRCSHLGGRLPAYDGSKSLFTAGSLPFTSEQFVIKLTYKDQYSDATRREREYKVKIRFVGKAALHHLLQFLQGLKRGAPQETIQVLDVAMRESPSLNYTTVARSFFAAHFGQHPIGAGLECWLGYYQSLRPTQMGLSMNIDTTAAPFYKPIPVLDFIAEYLRIQDIRRPLSDTVRVQIKKALRGVKVEITHRRDTPRWYKIKGITYLPTNQLMFPIDKEGRRISVIKYFKEKYNYSLKHVTLPCLQAGTENRPTYLPMEVCRIVEGQRYSKKLNEQQVIEMLKSTCKHPSERKQSILQMIYHNNYNNDVVAQEFGITVSQHLATVQARVLPAPVLKYHESGKEKTCSPTFGQWNMIDKKMVDGGTVDHWTCLNFSQKGEDVVQQFCKSLVEICMDSGMVFNPNPVIDIRTTSHDNIEAALREVHTQSTRSLDPQGINGTCLQLLLVILPEVSGLYGRIKRICETELDIVSQCCSPKKINGHNKQYLVNLALKINVKVGGRNTVLADALHGYIPFITDEPTIIFGADVTHPPPGEDSSSSIAAVVASMDWPHVSKYRGLVSAQLHQEELIQHLFTENKDSKKGIVYGGMIRELLIAFYKSTNLKAQRIMFYRDGVSEGQFHKVLLYEMTAIRRACASIEEGYYPKVTFVVVQKRHHTRFFPSTTNRKNCDKTGNVLPGTVVDQQVCHPQEFDFYLCSHAGIKGTSRPTHYHILWDENGFKADELQTLTHSLCYTYARCTRSVSIVPPAYYAHLAAYRARFYTEGEPSDYGSKYANGNTQTKGDTIRSLPQIKENVKKVMFFC